MSKEYLSIHTHQQYVIQCHAVSKTLYDKLDNFLKVLA